MTNMPAMILSLALALLSKPAISARLVMMAEVLPKKILFCHIVCKINLFSLYYRFSNQSSVSIFVHGLGLGEMK